MKGIKKKTHKKTEKREKTESGKNRNVNNLINVNELTSLLKKIRSKYKLFMRYGKV